MAAKPMTFGLVSTDSKPKRRHAFNPNGGDLLIYGREKSKGRYYPMNYKDGNLTHNLIYASRWPPSAYRHVLELVDYLNEHNSGFEFQVRQINARM